MLSKKILVLLAVTGLCLMLGLGTSLAGDKLKVAAVLPGGITDG